MNNVIAVVTKKTNHQNIVELLLSVDIVYMNYYVI